MTAQQARSAMLAYRGADARDAYGGLQQIKHLYLGATLEGQAEMRRVIAEWLTSREASDLYDGLWLTDELRLTENVPRLRELLAEAEHRNDHEAPFVWSKINGILARVLSADSQQ